VGGSRGRPSRQGSHRQDDAPREDGVGQVAAQARAAAQLGPLVRLVHLLKAGLHGGGLCCVIAWLCCVTALSAAGRRRRRPALLAGCPAQQLRAVRRAAEGGRARRAVQAQRAHGQPQDEAGARAHCGSRGRPAPPQRAEAAGERAGISRRWACQHGHMGLSRWASGAPSEQQLSTLLCTR